VAVGRPRWIIVIRSCRPTPRGEFGLELEAGAIDPGFGRVEEQAIRPVDDAEEVFVAVEPVARGPERHDPRRVDPEVALGLDDPAGVVRSVEGLLAALLADTFESAACR
jgi:hypothetical protein